MRWISVKEAFPTVLGREYLVWCEGNKCSYTACLVSGGYDADEWQCFNSGEKLPAPVTHWMPCPIGPKE